MSQPPPSSTHQKSGSHERNGGSPSTSNKNNTESGLQPQPHPATPKLDNTSATTMNTPIYQNHSSSNVHINDNDNNGDNNNNGDKGKSKMMLENQDYASQSNKRDISIEDGQDNPVDSMNISSKIMYNPSHSSRGLIHNHYNIHNSYSHQNVNNSSNLKLKTSFDDKNESPQQTHYWVQQQKQQMLKMEHSMEELSQNLLEWRSHFDKSLAKGGF